MQPALLPTIFSDRHLLGIEGLSAGAITHLLDLSEGYVALNREVQKRKSLLGGRTVVLLFFETSTRTRTSFELAGKRLGADVINIAVASSAIKKGETLIDTAMTLNAMHPDMLVMRHPDAGAAPAAREPRRVRGDQRGRRQSRASHTGAAGCAHHPPPLRPHPGAPGRHLRRCAAQPGRPLQHPAAQHHGRGGSALSRRPRCCRRRSSAWVWRSFTTCAQGSRAATSS